MITDFTLYPPLSSSPSLSLSLSHNHIYIQICLFCYRNLGLETHNFRGYSSCLDLLYVMIDEDARPKEPGYFSPTLFDLNEDIRVHDLTRQTRIRFERQYIERIDTMIERESHRIDPIPAEEAKVRLTRTKKFVHLQIQNKGIYLVMYSVMLCFFVLLLLCNFFISFFSLMQFDSTCSF